VSDAVNLFDTSRTTDESDPAGYQVPYARLRQLVGGSDLGITVYELTEGNSICPYHYEWTEEEWLIVLEGTPTLRTPDGEEELSPGDVVCFKMGPEGAHKVTNCATGRALVAMLSTQSETSVCVYPDSDKVGVFPPGMRLLVPRSAGVDYWHGEI
jgi:uncharacterized cupin superfamily protein